MQEGKENSFSLLASGILSLQAAIGEAALALAPGGAAVRADSAQAASSSLVWAASLPILQAPHLPSGLLTLADGSLLAILMCLGLALPLSGLTHQLAADLGSGGLPTQPSPWELMAAAGLSRLAWGAAHALLHVAGGALAAGIAAPVVAYGVLSHTAADDGAAAALWALLVLLGACTTAGAFAAAAVAARVRVRPTLAALVAPVVLFAASLPRIALGPPGSPQASLAARRAAAALLPPAAFAFGCDALIAAEITSPLTSPSAGPSPSLPECFCWLLFSCATLSLVAVALELRPHPRAIQEAEPPILGMSTNSSCIVAELVAASVSYPGGATAALQEVRSGAGLALFQHERVGSLRMNGLGCLS